MTEETCEEEDAMYWQWYDMDDFCPDDDDDENEYFDDDNFGNIDDNDYDYDDDDNDDDNDDHSDDDDLLNDHDDDVTDTFEDDVAPFRSMGFLGADYLFSAMRHLGRGRRHCPRLNWLKQPDLYKEFTFNPPPGKVHK